METIHVKHWYAVEKIIDEMYKDQKEALSENLEPLEIASKIQNINSAISDMKETLEHWKECFGYPNVSNLKYIDRY